MKEQKNYPVEIRLAEEIRTYSPEFQRAERYAFAWKRVLTMAHGKAVVRCQCGGQGEKRLSVHSRSNTDGFHLARFPDTGSEHSEDCVYYGVDPNASGLGSYKRGVVEELDDGSTKIKLKVGLQQRLTKAPIDSQPSTQHTHAARTGTNQSSMTLLGLLHFLWTQAAMNTWSPAMKGKRNLGVVHHYVMAVAMVTFAGRVKLSQNLLVATAAENSQQARLNQAKTLSAGDERRRLIICAPLSRYREELISAKNLPISGYHGIPHLAMTGELWEITQRRFSREISAWLAGNRVMAIAQTDPPKMGGGAAVIDLALMWLTDDWIPVDSGFEAMVGQKMVNEDRHFEKPLRFDSQAQVFPDFWLKDMQTPMPMEVWGMATPDYQARKQEKIAHYDTTYGKGNWWSWNGAAGDPMPELPLASSTTIN